jgi:hypothetical protein
MPLTGGALDPGDLERHYGGEEEGNSPMPKEMAEKLVEKLRSEARVI